MNKKNLLIAVAALLFSIQIQAQAPAKEKEQSNAEVFSSKAGTLMQKEFVEIGTLKKAKVQVLYYTDLISNMKKSALKFELEVASSYSTDTKVAVLDVDEIDGLMKSIKLMQDKVMVTVPANYTDIYSCDVDPLFLHVDPLGKLAIIVRA